MKAFGWLTLLKQQQRLDRMTRAEEDPTSAREQLVRRFNCVQDDSGQVFLAEAKRKPGVW
jgi:hypothetical protein